MIPGAAAKTGYDPEAAGLAPRERAILASSARIAAERGIRPVTVRNNVYAIRSKLGAGSMQELVLWAVRHGLLDDYATEG